MLSRENNGVNAHGLACIVVLHGDLSFAVGTQIIDKAGFSDGCGALLRSCAKGLLPGSRTRIGFDGQISAHAALKHLTIRQYSLRVFALPEQKSAPAKLRAPVGCAFFEIFSAFFDAGGLAPIKTKKVKIAGSFVVGYAATVLKCRQRAEKNQTVLVVIGEADRLDAAYIEDMEIVEYVRAITQPYKLAGHKAPNDSSVVDVGGVKIGGGTFTMIAGPCSVESTQQIIDIAREIKSAGAQLLRGGAFKPRTSPYSFQGMRADGLPPLIEAGQNAACRQSAG